MTRSKGRSASSTGGGRRLQTIGLFVTLILVAVLIGSLVAGLRGGGTASEDPEIQPKERAVAAREPSGPPIRIAVWNASGVPKLADRGRAELREDRRFDVKEIGNAPGFSPDSSVVLDRVGNIDLAREVADALGIARVETRPDTNLYLDVTVVLGKDWARAAMDTTALP